MVRPLRAVAPALEQAAKERRGKLKIVKLNVDENPRISALHQVQSIPTLILQRGPLFIGRVRGALPKSSWTHSSIDTSERTAAANSSTSLARRR